MGEMFATGGYEDEQRMLAEHCLTEVDHLVRLRRPDGTHDQAVLEAAHVNLRTAVMEAAMPYAVSTTHQEYRDETYWWLDQTPEQVAASGYKFHRHPAALARVDVEVDEARDVNQNLRPGYIKMLLSPKMSRADVPYEIAKQEHLADDDMVRIHMLNINEKGVIEGKFMQSVLVRDIPLSAWVAMLRDPNNIFGKSISVRDEQSALSVMEVHRELEVPEDRLPEGVISIIDAVLPYLDKESRYKVESQLLLFRGNQEELQQKAELIADRWLAFEVGLADSLTHKRATFPVEQFVYQLQHQWGDDMLAMLDKHRLDDGGIYMTRELAAKIEQARRNTLWVSAAVITNNEEVLAKLDGDAATRIYNNEMMIQSLMVSGYSAHDIAAFEAQSNRLVASQNIKVGGGCPGDSEADFRNNRDNSGPEGATSNTSGNNNQSKEDWKWKSGVCRIVKCPTRPGPTQVGPCAVCRGCQRLFDTGRDPLQVYGTKTKAMAA